MHSETGPLIFPISPLSSFAQRFAQVDFYFSDDNLAKDNFLRQKMVTKTKKNKPLKLDVIHKFRKMQEYQPVEAVVEALRFSKAVNVIRDNDQWYLQRKVPFDKEAFTGIPKAKVNFVSLLDRALCSPCS